MKTSAVQDRAAGGRERRKVTLEDGSLATTSVELKQPHDGRAVWAYLRWFANGKTTNRYIGRVRGSTREELLQDGFRLAREKGLL